jgi:hypothetical protein
MRARLIFVASVAFLLALAATPARAFEVGFNQAWIAEAYGRDFTTGWNPAEVDLMFIRTKAAGATAVRIWLFEGMEKDGVTFSGTRATGLAPGFLANVEWTCQAARRHGVKVYWTGLNGNFPWARGTRWSFIHYNILNDRFGEGSSFRWRALGPVLDVLARYRDTIYAFDLMNEVEGSMSLWMWSNGWDGARKWIRDEAAFVHGRLPGVPVTASAGWHTAAENLVNGKYTGLGLDFYDLHVYNDTGSIPNALGLRMLSWRTATPILLGEYGQKTERYDDALQRRVTQGFLRNAKSQRFMGAFAWRLDDERPAAPAFVPYHSYTKNDRERPAVADVRAFAAQNTGGWDIWDYVLGLVR